MNIDVSDDTDFCFGNFDLTDALEEQTEAFRNGSMSSFAVDPVWPGDYADIFRKSFSLLFDHQLSLTASLAQPPSAAPHDNNQFFLYQSRDSLATSTMSASSGYAGIPPQQPFLDLDDLSKQFRDFFVMPGASEIDDSGKLNVESFNMSYPVVTSMMDDFVTVACSLLYCAGVLHDWPNSEVLNGLSQMAVDLVLKVHHADKLATAEIGKCLGLSNYEQALIII
jgi:hypothetical protein